MSQCFLSSIFILEFKINLQRTHAIACAFILRGNKIDDCDCHLPSEFSGSDRSESDGTFWMLRIPQSSGSSFIFMGAPPSKCCSIVQFQLVEGKIIYFIWFQFRYKELTKKKSKNMEMIILFLFSIGVDFRNLLKIKTRSIWLLKYFDTKISILRCKYLRGINYAEVWRSCVNIILLRKTQFT